jgi:sugar phosphate isomerase/epimerase
MIPPEKLAVCSWSLQPTSSQDLVEKVRATGLSRVQLHLNPLSSDSGFTHTSAHLAEAGIDIVSGMVTCPGEDYTSIAAITRTGGIVPDATWPATLAEMRDAANVAGRIGCRLVTFHAGFVPHDRTDPSRAKLIDRLRQVAEIFAAADCSVALETGQEDAAALADLLDEVGGDVGVNFDPANMILYGSGDPVEALHHLMPRIRQIHLKDAKGSTTPGVAWGEEVPVGTGEVDWLAFFAVAKKSRYDGDFCIEREAGDARVDDIRTAAAFIA